MQRRPVSKCQIVDHSSVSFFQISEIDFHDNVSLTFDLVLDPGLQLPIGQIDVNTVVLLDVTYRGPTRADRANTGLIYSGLYKEEFSFNTGTNYKNSV